MEVEEPVGNKQPTLLQLDDKHLQHVRKLERRNRLPGWVTRVELNLKKEVKQVVQLTQSREC